MKKHLRLTLLSTFFALFVFALQASAQTIGTPGASTNAIGWGMNNLFYSNRVFNGMMANRAAQKGVRNGRRQGAGAGAKSTRATVDHTAFRETPGIVLLKNLDNKTDIQNRRQLEQIFKESVDLYKLTARKDGFPANDLAYAFEYFIVNNYQVALDLVSLPTEKDPFMKNAVDGFDRISLAAKKRTLQVQMYQEKAVYLQFKDLLADNAEVQKMTDAQKQEATELLAAMFGINYAGYLKGVDAGDEKLIEQARVSARAGIEKLLGVAIERLKFTGNGIEF